MQMTEEAGAAVAEAPVHAITLLPSGKAFSSPAGESVLDAALRQGILLPHQCKTGTCGACRARVVDGEAVCLPGAQPTALAADEAAQGVRLLCCTGATSSLRIECAEIPHIAGIAVRKLPVRIAAMPPSLPADTTRVNLASTVEVNYWCQTLNCTETRLRNAVLAVGLLAVNVRNYLNG